jgi:hypothetical protein
VPGTVRWLIATMPMTKWSASSKGLISYENDRFKLEFDIAARNEQILYEMTSDICQYRLDVYFERRGKNKIGALCHGLKNLKGSVRT